MRLILPVDSRVTDAAGLVFIDLLRRQAHAVPVETGRRQRRNGFRGGCLIGGQLFVCTSSQVMKLDIQWPQAGEPRVQVIQVIRRPEWIIGGRANADLHHLRYDDANNCLQIANSFMDCVDTVDMRGNLLGRRYLWDMNDEIMGFAYERLAEAADLCHVNHISTCCGEVVLTLANLNGTRKGALLSLSSGRFLLRDLAFPHDGVMTREGFWLTEAEGHRVTLFGPGPSGDLGTTPTVTIDVSRDSGRDVPLPGRIWVRGLHVGNEVTLVGCSCFDDLDAQRNETTPSHLVVLDRRSHKVIGRIGLPSLQFLNKPVIYSIICYDGDARLTDLDLQQWNSPETRS